MKKAIAKLIRAEAEKLPAKTYTRKVTKRFTRAEAIESYKKFDLPIPKNLRDINTLKVNEIAYVNHEALMKHAYDRNGWRAVEQYIKEANDGMLVSAEPPE